MRFLALFVALVGCSGGGEGGGEPGDGACDTVAADMEGNYLCEANVWDSGTSCAVASETCCTIEGDQCEYRLQGGAIPCDGTSCSTAADELVDCCF